MRQTRPQTPNYVAIEELFAHRNSKWTAPVVLHLRSETMRFTELQRDIGTISQKALSATLRALERDGFVTRTSYPTIPPRVDYELTELGTEILALLEGFEAFATRHWSRVLDARRTFDDNQSQQTIYLLRASGE